MRSHHRLGFAMDRESSRRGPQYSRTRELPALKISLADMQSVLEKASHLLSDANREDGKKPKDIYLTETLPLLPMSPPRLSALLEPP